ncbi:MAG: hypothetical protein DHS20C16_31670 [Phycisphaerae bacterium]|nr:MAG: hypothetical protein DHS20C16_31670 [Phycisphaerae bacterium]
MQRITLIAVIAVAASILCGCSGAEKSGFEVTGQSEKLGHQAIGVVFNDRNGNGQRDGGEHGIGGVSISNGEDVVVTNSRGEYAIGVDDDTVVFVIKPTGWMTRVDEHHSPRFYYVHKPNGSPTLRYAGVDPTGPLPESIDFPLQRQHEPKRFRAILFGDTQPESKQHIYYLAHDIVEELVGYDASFGVSLGDLVSNNLDLFQPLNEVIGHVGLPWYSVIGNHDINFDASEDKYSDETYERVYGPSSYAFNWGKVHFIVLDDVHWMTAEELKREKGGYRGELGERQLKFVANDLATVPKDRLVVLMMHIPLGHVRDREELLALLEDRPHTFSMSAHRHVQHHHFFSNEDKHPHHDGHHHFVNATTCGSWWNGELDEENIPHTTMRDGAPNGYSIVTFDGNDYSIRFKAARRPQDHQMTIYAPNEVTAALAGATEVVVNVFAGSVRSKVEMRFGGTGEWTPMTQVDRDDPYYLDMKKREAKLGDLARKMPKVIKSEHIWTANLPADAPLGSHLIHVRTTDMFGQTYTDQRVIAIRATEAETNLD